MTARQQYREAWRAVRVYAEEYNPGDIVCLEWVRAIPVTYRRAAARSFNARRKAGTTKC